VKLKHVSQDILGRSFCPISGEVPLYGLVWQWERRERVERKLSVSFPTWKHFQMRKLAPCAITNISPTTSRLGTNSPYF